MRSTHDIRVFNGLRLIRDTWPCVYKSWDALYQLQLVNAYRGGRVEIANRVSGERSNCLAQGQAGSIRLKIHWSVAWIIEA